MTRTSPDPLLDLIHRLREQTGITPIPLTEAEKRSGAIEALATALAPARSTPSNRQALPSTTPDASSSEARLELLRRLRKQAGITPIPLSETEKRRGVMDAVASAMAPAAPPQNVAHTQPSSHTPQAIPTRHADHARPAARQATATQQDARKHETTRQAMFTREERTRNTSLPANTAPASQTPPSDAPPLADPLQPSPPSKRMARHLAAYKRNR